MLVLLLCPNPASISSAITASGDRFISTTDPIDMDFIERHQVDFVVSYRYRHIIKPDVLDLLAGRNCNLHVAMLPWNRGADPNFWSWVDGTPKGVTIHVMDKALDTGPILCQRPVTFSEPATLASTYDDLQREIIDLFCASWPDIRSGRMQPKPQSGKSSYHRSSEKTRLMEALPLGLNTKISDLALHLNVPTTAPLRSAPTDQVGV